MAVVICGSCERYEQARKKAEDPKMTLQGNPLAERGSSYQHEEMVERNMERLYKDASRYSGIHGNAYAAVRSMTFKGD